MQNKQKQRIVKKQGALETITDRSGASRNAQTNPTKP